MTRTIFWLMFKGPNKEADVVNFFPYLSTTLHEVELESNDNVIIGGHFNCPLARQRIKREAF